MYGCLLALLIGFVFILFSLFASVAQIFTDVKRSFRRAMGGEKSSEQTTMEEAEAAKAGKDRHSHRRPSGRFFDKDEGDYVPFEEIP